MSDEHPDAPSTPPGPPPYPGTAPPSAPPPYNPPPPYNAPPPPYPPGGGAPGGYYPPGAPPGQWAGAPGPGYGYGPVGYPGAAPYAGYWARVGGLLLDGVIIFVGSLIFLLPAHAFRSMHTINSGRVYAHVGISGGGLVFLLVVGALYASLLIGLRGQTVGMMAARIKAVDATTGGLIGFWRALGRDLFERLLGALFVIPVIIDLLFPAWDPRHQTLHDKVTNTVVIKV